MSVYLKLEGMYCTGFENVCVCRGGGGGRVKNWYFSLNDSEGGGISEINIQKDRAFRNKAIRK